MYKGVFFFISFFMIMSLPQKNTSPLLRLAIQKSGRITEETMNLLRKSGLDIPKNGRSLRARAKNFPLEILFLRTKDIPRVVQKRLADIGFVGQNLLQESKFLDLTEILSLGFGECRLSLAVPKNGKIQKIQDLQKKKIATSHPVLLQRFLDTQGISAEIISMNGSVEIAPSLKLADAICDLVSTGNTLLANQLQEIEVIFSSEVVLISTAQREKEKEKIFSDFLLRIQSVLNAKKMKSVVMNAPKEALEKIKNILPGLESPTVMPLEEKGWVAIHSVVREDEEFWGNIARLKNAGACGILISPIDRIIF